MLEQEPDAPESKRPSGRLQVEQRFSPDARCAFCHDALDDESAVCPGCKTVLHRDCRALLPECPTLGCRLSYFTLVPANAPPRPMRTRPAFRAALARMAQRQAETPRERPVDPRWAEWEPHTFVEGLADVSAEAAPGARYLLRLGILVTLALISLAAIIAAASMNPWLGFSVAGALFLSLGVLGAIAFTGRSRIS